MKISRPVGISVVLTALAGMLTLSIVSWAEGTPSAQPAKSLSSSQSHVRVPLRIMPLGDSISKDDGAGHPGAYRTPLWELAQEDGVPTDFVGSLSNGPVELPDKDHEGHGGFSIQQLDGIVAPTLRAHRPDIILLHIGSNDMYKKNVPLASRQLSALVDHIIAVAPNARLYVAGIIPQPKYEDQVRKFNKATRAMVGQKAAMGANVKFVDMYGALTANDLHDGLHPTPEGYEKMAEVWWSAITADYSGS